LLEWHLIKQNIMAKKSELVSAINSYSAARATNDGNLISMSGSVLQQLIETIVFDSEEEEQKETVSTEVINTPEDSIS